VEVGEKPLTHRFRNGDDAALPTAHRVRGDVVALDLALRRQLVELVGLLLLRPPFWLRRLKSTLFGVASRAGAAAPGADLALLGPPGVPYAPA